MYTAKRPGKTLHYNLYPQDGSESSLRNTAKSVALLLQAYGLWNWQFLMFLLFQVMEEMMSAWSRLQTAVLGLRER